MSKGTGPDWAETIRERRNRYRLSQEIVAREVGVPREALSMYETGRIPLSGQQAMNILVAIDRLALRLDEEVEGGQPRER